MLLRHCCSLSDAALITSDKEVLNADAWNRYEHAIEQRRGGIPVAYITGQREFWSMKLLVTPDVLIPRPETELLVELTLEKIDKDTDALIADLGTGSGAISLAIAMERTHCRVVATDSSNATLNIARQNAQRLNIYNVEFLKSNWLELVDGKDFDLIVSNPPYVCSGDPHLNQGDVRFEPQAALVSGTDGLDAIKVIAQQSQRYLKPGGFLIVEHGSEQAQAVREIFFTHGFINPCTHKDLAGLARVCLGQK